MRICYISNVSTMRCGVAEFGRQHVATLRALGHDVTEWDGNYPVIYERVQRNVPAYVPGDWAEYDILHLNWHPTITNHYVPSILPPHPRFSIMLHDIPPHTVCACIERAHVLFALEPCDAYPDVTEISPPMVDYVPTSPLAELPTVGRTSVGDINRIWLQEICDRHGWLLSNSGFQTQTWIPIEEELERLARCWVNVVWYQEERSRSSAAIAAAFARRPLLLSRNTRFDNFLPYADEVYFGEYQHLEERLVEVMAEVAAGTARKPTKIPLVFGWKAATQKMLDVWAGSL